jgi:hypothetical protein
MLSELHARKRLQMGVGLLAGIAFGFLLHKGAVTRYDIIIGQLLLRDFTVVKVMLSAMVTGMIGVHALRSLRLAQLHPKPGSAGMTVVGSVIFGVGFGLLGYCPGTIMGAAAQGSLDALFGIAGLLVGAGLFASLYPRLESGILQRGSFGDLTWPRLLRVNPWAVVVPVAAAMVGLLFWIESAGL